MAHVHGNPPLVDSARSDGRSTSLDGLETTEGRRTARATPLDVQRATTLGHRPEVFLRLGPRPARAIPAPSSGHLVQATVTATARLDDNARITGIRVSGRPKGRFKGGAQGSHVTAFGIFRDVLESATLGRKVEKAYENVDDLVDDLKELPGYAKAKKSLPTGRPEAADTNDVEVYELQELMVYYLEARDAAEYSAAFLGEGQAKGKGEGTVLRRLRELENEGGLDRSEVVEAKALVEGLYDTDAVDELVSTADSKTSGKIPGRARLQHLMTVFQAFPKVYSDLHQNDSTAFPDFSNELSQPEARKNYDRATGRDLFLNLGVMATPTAQGGYDVSVTGRPAGPFSQTSTMGSHTIPYSLLVEAATRQMATADSATAVRQRLLDMLEAEAGSSLKTFDNDLSQNAKTRFEAATKILDEVIDHLKDTTPSELDATDVEGAVEALILHHNTSPLSAVDLGLANNKAEQFSLSQLRDYEGGGLGKTASVRSEAVQRAYKLLDGATIASFVDNSGTDTNMPGAAGNAVKEIAAILDSFFEHVEQAFPAFYAQALPHHEDNITYYLNQQLGLAIDADRVMKAMSIRPSTAKLTRGSRLEDADRRAAQRPTSKRKSNRKNDEDEDFVPGKRRR